MNCSSKGRTYVLNGQGNSWLGIGSGPKHTIILRNDIETYKINLKVNQNGWPTIEKFFDSPAYGCLEVLARTKSFMHENFISYMTIY